VEEGPEPQELMESVGENIESKHEGEEKESSSSKRHSANHMRSAITAAILAVCAAIGSLLSGHSANDAILLQSKASDQWSYYQAKSTKGHLYEVNRTLVEAFMQMNQAGKTGGGTAGVDGAAAQKPLKDLTVQIESKMKGYEKEKTLVEDKATELEKESEHAFAAHEMYSFGVACFQIGIVMASVSILVESAPLYMMSIAGGVLGVVLLIVGYLR
jgi:uncharacterized membrane protein